AVARTAMPLAIGPLQLQRLFRDPHLLGLVCNPLPTLLLVIEALERPGKNSRLVLGASILPRRRRSGSLGLAAHLASLAVGNVAGPFAPLAHLADSVAQFCVGRVQYERDMGFHDQLEFVVVQGTDLVT